MEITRSNDGVDDHALQRDVENPEHLSPAQSTANVTQHSSVELSGNDSSYGR